MQQNSSYIDQISPAQEQAEELMNSLFSEVEQTLSINLTTNLIADLAGTELVKYIPEDNFQQSGSLSLQSSSISSRLESAIAIIPKSFNSKTAKHNSIDLDTTRIAKRIKIEKKVNLFEPELDEKLSQPKTSESVGFIDSLLLGSALTSAIFAVVLGLVNRKIPAYTPVYSNISNSQIQSNDSLAPVAENLRRSLDEIPDKPNDVNPKQIPNSNTLTNSVIDTPVNSPQVKPIYIPIYQPTAPTPSVPSNPTPITPTNTTVSAIAPAPVLRDKRSDKKFDKKTAGTYTLIGVLELGDRSTAIIDINGSIKSLKIGSVVADSGWTISRIAQQEVLLKRGSEDTTVTVGQKF